MATITTNTHAGGASASILLAPFRGIGRFLVALAETSPKMHAFNRLSETTDEQLAAKGLTRDGEIRRILGAAAV